MIKLRTGTTMTISRAEMTRAETIMMKTGMETITI